VIVNALTHPLKHYLSEIKRSRAFADDIANSQFTSVPSLKFVNADLTSTIGSLDTCASRRTRTGAAAVVLILHEHEMGAALQMFTRISTGKQAPDYRRGIGDPRATSPSPASTSATSMSVSV
jgi:hypothetical protein